MVGTLLLDERLKSDKITKKVTGSLGKILEKKNRLQMSRIFRIRSRRFCFSRIPDREFHTVYELRIRQVFAL